MKIITKCQGGITTIKKIIFLATCFLPMLSVSAPVYAAELELPEQSTISPQYVNINKATCTLTISSNGVAKIKGYVQKTKSGTSIYLRSTLQCYKNGSWNDIKSWSKTSTSSTALISESYTVSAGKYRVETYYSVNGAGGTETGTIYSKTVNY